MIWLHGAGEGSTESTLNTTKKGNLNTLALITSVPNPQTNPAKMVTLGWKKDAVDPRTGIRDTFILIAPQHLQKWSYSYNELRFMIPDIMTKYRVDTTRMYLVGLSAGGSGINTCLGSRDSLFLNRLAGVVTTIAAGVNTASGPAGSFTTTQVVNNMYLAPSYGVRVWKINGEQDGSRLNPDLSYHNNLNSTNPTPRNKFTVFAGIGHTSSPRFFDTASRPITNYYGNTGTCNSGCAFGGVPVQANNNGSTVRGSGVTQDSLNIYEWMLSNVRNIPNTPVPTAVAGTDQVITAPTSTATLNGTGSAAGSGATMISYTWEKLSGPANGAITSPTSATTGLTGLVPGNYIFRLTVVNSIGVSHTDDIRITVNNNVTYNHPTVSLSTSATQNITVSNTTVTATATTTGATVKSVRWTKLKTPGYTSKKIFWSGSSTIAGSGASTGDSAVYNRFVAFTTAQGLGTNARNAVGGTSIFQYMPTGTTPGAGEDSPDPTFNVTWVLANHSDANVIVVSFPSNDYDALTTDRIVYAYQTIYNTITAAGKKCIIHTTQPRTEFGTNARLRLREIHDSLYIREVKGLFAPGTIISVHPGLTSYDGLDMLYNSGDNIHQNNTGHRVIAFNSIGHNMWESYNSSSAVITNPTSLSTTITGLGNGEHKFMVAVTDDHDQTVYAVTTINVNLSSNTPPNANAGTDVLITLPVSSTNLSASGSNDPDGNIVSYAWTKVSGPGAQSITNPNNMNVTVTGLVEGTFVFRVTVTDDDGATDTDDVQIVVQPAPTPTCSGIRYVAQPIGYYFNSFDLKPGDTLDLANFTYQYVYIANKNGLPQCPIVIINSGGVANIKAPGINPGNPSNFYGDGSQLKLENCTYVKVTGSGSGDQYGIKVQPYGDDTLRNGSHAVSIIGRSKNIEIERVEVRNAGIGYNIKQDESCEPELQYPNWIMDSIFVHHGKIRHTWNQGIYAGNTAPDNAADALSPRPIVCDGVTTYPRPIRLGNIHIYNMDIDSTGRAGIQVSSASVGQTLVYNNTVKHAGMTGDPGQGFGIVFGGYTRGKIYNNTVVNTYMYGIGSQAGSGDTPIEITGNTIDSSGSLNHFGTSVFSGEMIKISTRTITNWDNAYTVYNIFLTTLTNMDGETTGFTITGNTLGLKNKTENIGFNGALFRAGIICNNINSLGGAVTATYEGPVVTWSGCDVNRYILRKSRVGRLKFRL